jgi:hypothetical protein
MNDENICGLDVTDLYSWQLRKLDFEKLIKLIDQDERVQYIITSKLRSTPSLCYLECVVGKAKSSNLTKYVHLNETYNYVILNHFDILYKEFMKNLARSSYRYVYFHRSKYIYWDLLNDQLKNIELQLYINGKESTFVFNKNSMNWIITAAPQLLDKVIECTQSSLLLEVLSAELLDKYKSRFAQCQNNIMEKILNNPDATNELLLPVVKRIAGRARAKYICAPINKALLMQLSPVKRLDVVETLVYYSAKFENWKDIKTREDLAEILYSVSIKYNSRVTAVLNRFEYLLKKE